MSINSGLRATGALFVGLLAIAVGGCNKTSEKTGASPPGTTVGTVIDDTGITASVKSALVADPDVKGRDIKVETRKGEVLLSGFVDSQAQIDRATTLARNVNGVKAVDNKLAVKAADATVGAKVDDSIVTTQVKSALLADANVKSLDIAVVTRNGEVQLSGFVDNQGQIDQAVKVAKGVSGVQSVSNQMSVKK